MDNLNTSLFDYASQNSSPEPVLLKELRRETWQKILNPRMLSGHLQGRLLSFISRIVQPKKILEIGTYTGYATLCLAEGLQEDGYIITIDKNEELLPIQEKYFKKSNFKAQIKNIIGDAQTIIPTLEETFDLVFIDGQKTEYKSYFDYVFPKVKKGGIILSDNVLWYGKVLHLEKFDDVETQSIYSYNEYLKDYKGIDYLILPLRDGLSICVKK